MKKENKSSIHRLKKCLKNPRAKTFIEDVWAPVIWALVAKYRDPSLSPTSRLVLLRTGQARPESPGTSTMDTATSTPSQDPSLLSRASIDNFMYDLLRSGPLTDSDWDTLCTRLAGTPTTAPSLDAKPGSDSAGHVRGFGIRPLGLAQLMEMIVNFTNRKENASQLLVAGLCAIVPPSVPLHLLETRKKYVDPHLLDIRELGL